MVLARQETRGGKVKMGVTEGGPKERKSRVVIMVECRIDTMAVVMQRQKEVVYVVYVRVVNVVNEKRCGRQSGF